MAQALERKMMRLLAAPAQQHWFPVSFAISLDTGIYLYDLSILMF
jgi:hypothetical protein